jgi:flavin-dependent dehydrogenase
MNAADKYDVAVLGSGTGGKLMARAMAQKGMRTAVVERRYIGGSCVDIAARGARRQQINKRSASLEAGVA